MGQTHCSSPLIAGGSIPCRANGKTGSKDFLLFELVTGNAPGGHIYGLKLRLQCDRSGVREGGFYLVPLVSAGTHFCPYIMMEV